MILYLASSNPGKSREFTQILSAVGIEVKPAPVSFECEETGSTFMENAQIKAHALSALIPDPVLADDSGLCVDALNGEPGVYSARYAGVDTPFAQKIETLLNALAGTENRSARFSCALVLMQKGKILFETLSHCEGTIALEPKGTHGFGYDPIFYLPAYGKTMAELSPDVKNHISHRAKALQAFMKATQFVSFLNASKRCQ